MRSLKLLPLLALLFLACSQKPQGVTHQVEIKLMKFVPDVIEVAVGDSITWTNKDLVEHNVVNKAENGWKSESLKTNESFSVKIESKSDLDYLCTLHPIMTGVIKIKN